MQKCNKCKISKPLSEFPKSKKSRAGVRGDCKECQKIYQKIYREDNKQSIRNYQQVYRLANKKETSCRDKVRYKNNKEYYKNKARIYITSRRKKDKLFLPKKYNRIVKKDKEWNQKDFERWMKINFL